jgi:hypothetical protein
VQTSFRPYRNLGHFELITELMKGLEGEYSARLERDREWHGFVGFNWRAGKRHRTDQLSERFHTGRTWEAVIVLYKLDYAMYNGYGWVCVRPKSECNDATRFLAAVAAYTTSTVGELRGRGSTHRVRTRDFTGDVLSR